MGHLLALSGISFQERVEDSYELSLSEPPGGSVRYIFQEKDHSWPIVSDDDLPLSGTNSGSVRYIFPGEGLLMADSDNDLCISEWAAWWLCQVYHSWRGIACGG